MSCLSFFTIIISILPPSLLTCLLLFLDLSLNSLLSRVLSFLRLNRRKHYAFSWRSAVYSSIGIYSCDEVQHEFLTLLFECFAIDFSVVLFTWRAVIIIIFLWVIRDRYILRYKQSSDSSVKINFNFSNSS